ncbi:MOSC domain-containing protein [Streptosporangium carneum]|uniref:MOSC domain-containing protein n=1 Tax=Streptosporangium carneum TaxID=47481 RepID=A0A9W6HXD8_9ACTN|nr:MOSC N-terminal beta barrel domain-containing protein [Streptosporangium carneum]GLK07506.1 MOSC domain-containing protein [Streptosporangium carneum]
MIVTELTVYPLKSGGGTALREAEITPRGIRHDRALMLVTPSGRHLSQREVPRMALLRPVYDGWKLRIDPVDPAVVETPLVLDVRRDGPARDITLFRAPSRGVDQGDAAAGWFSAVLGVPCRLVSFPDDLVRPVDPGHVRGEVGYADTYPLLVASPESLAELNTRLREPVPMNRFRPNIVVSGWGEPFGEDRARRLRVGDVEIELVKPCGRCMIVNVDQETGVRGREPLRALAAFRTVEQRILFGQRGVPRTAGVIRVGDPVVVLDR